MPVSLGRSDPGQPAYVTLVAGQHLSNLRVGLIRSARLEGRIQGEGGQVLAGVPIQLIRDDSSTPGVRQRMDSIAQASTAADGSYRLSAFVPGRYILIAGYPRALNGAAAQSFAARIEVPNTDLQTLDFSLDSKGGHAVRGKVSIDGTSGLPADVHFSIRAASPSATTGSGDENVTSAYDPNSGRFEIPGLYPGLYEIYLSSQIPMRCAGATAVVLHDDAGPLDLILRECQRLEIRATP